MSARTGVASGSPDRFGYEWHTYSEMRPEYEEQFRRWTMPLTPADWPDKTILDVGCGMGRNTYWPLKYGARRSVSIDVDDRSLGAAQQTLQEFRNATVERRSAYDIGYENAFDIVYSIGVIHHLEHPELALGQMVKAAKPGGQILVWVYGRENNGWIVLFLDPLRKALFSRLPVGFVHHLSIYPTALLWLLLRLGIGRVAYFDLIRSLSFRHLRSIVFDQMLPKIANYWPKHVVEEMMRRAGLADIQLTWVNQMSWSALGTKLGT